MRIDKVEQVWSDLEQSFSKSRVKSRLEFLKGLVRFTGTKGNVKLLEAQLKVDLDSSAETTLRYRAICKMLEATEEYLLRNTTEIPDLNEWLERMSENESKVDLSKLQIRYSPDTEEKLKDNIHLGFVFPGFYGKTTVLTFPARLNNYVFLNSLPEMQNFLAANLQSQLLKDNIFLIEVIHLLYTKYSANEITFPCVFVHESLLNAPVFKFHRSKQLKQSGLHLLNSDLAFDLNCDEGLVEISAGTKLQTFIIKEN